MGESHAYGSSLFCISRRYFVMWFCIVMTGICAVRLLQWVISASLFVPGPGDFQKQAGHICKGTACYEVFTCFGMKDATAHIMEPLMTISGIIFYPIGFHAAHHGYDIEMKRFALYLLASIVIRLGVMSFDVAYISMCDAYDSNMMASVLSQFLPPSPLRVGVQEELVKLEVFPLQAVEDATNGFHIVTWYLSMAGALSLFFIYVLSEALALSGLMQYGLLGLGVHFGLDQWDEALNHTAIRRKAQNEIRSKFIDDAEVPFAQGPNPSYQGHQGYGTSSPRYATYEKGFSMGSASDFNSTRLESYPRYVEVADTEAFEEEEAEAVRALAEKLANEESPGALLDRAIFE
mmetsp:Transcript_134466/g.190101  ORF Transcript_134466/g.190101 Transcript_134466/m.190101 type:complete len:348 (+) Transcript_134466:76-1119(+)